MESLRERKKRLLRQQLSDTATRMFMERGFDAVRVIEVAEACGVSDKTVFNYFPTKEALVLDRLEGTVAALRTGLSDAETPPVEAALRILDGELSGMTAMLASQDDPAAAIGQMKRFGDLIHDTPSLRAYQSDMMDQFVAVASEILAARAGMSPDDPEPRITATALLGLWRIQFQALSRYLDGTRTPVQVHRAVTAEVNRAAELIDLGLRSFLPVARDVRGALPGPVQVAAQVTGQVDQDSPFGEAPLIVTALETVVVPPAHDGLQCQSGPCLENGDIGTGGGRAGLFVGVDDDIGGDVLGPRRAAVVDDQHVAEHLLDGACSADRGAAAGEGGVG
ncbi:MAG TPA: TetR family transcriptional regulator [Streptosporangiaceae bacterium]|nr:TetR family transcriptional regulator [Streptosporangiaceae bacterium]